MFLSETDIVREAYARYGRGDFAAVFELLAPTVEVLQSVDLPWGGFYTGLEGVGRFFALLNEHLDAVPDPVRYLGAGSEVAVVGRLAGKVRVTGAVFDVDFVHLWSVVDGRIVRLVSYLDTVTMLRVLAGGGARRT